MGFKELLKGKLSEEELKKVRRAFDLIGDIAIVEIPEGLEEKEGLIAEAIAKFHKNVKVVCKKAGVVSGEERVRPLEVIYGENRTETIHVENGCRFKLDVSKVFFTPRLASERMRVVGKVREGEIVADLFAGVGPYSIPIAKFAKPKVVYAIDKNPEAYKYLVENIKINKVVGKVLPFLGDCREVVEKEEIKGVDRVIMNLPKTADNFLDVAFGICKRGTTVHFYYFLREEELFWRGEEIIKENAEKFNRRVKFLEERKCGELAPRVYRVVIDFQIF